MSQLKVLTGLVGVGRVWSSGWTVGVHHEREDRGMTVAEMARVIGQTGTLSVEVSGGHGWHVPCEIVDVRQVWGRVQYRVRPVGSVGERVWVESSRVGVTA